MSPIFRNVRRLGVTVAATAATVGIVWLMRIGAQKIADGAMVEVSSAAEAPRPDREFMPRTYDLAKLVPSSLRANLGGMELASAKKRLPMPLELAMRQSSEEARAAGWEEMTMPLVYQVSTMTRFSQAFVTPDRRFVQRSFAPLVGSETMREDLVMPVGSYLELRRDMTLDEIAELHGGEVAQYIPEPLAAVRTVRPLFTQYFTHGEGGSFLVVGVSPLPVDATAAQVASAFARTGWTRSSERSGGWEKANLAASVDISPRDTGEAGADGAIVTFRISDDELLTRKDNEENE